MQAAELYKFSFIVYMVSFPSLFMLLLVSASISRLTTKKDPTRTRVSLKPVDIWLVQSHFSQEAFSQFSIE